MEKEKTEEGKRKLVVPGEIIATGEEFLPGDWTERKGKDIIAKRFGLAEEVGRLVKIIPLSGAYSPRRGNVVIGRVTDLTFNGWVAEIGGPYLAFLSLMESPRFVNKNDIAEFMDIGDMFVAKILNMKLKGIDLTIDSRGLGKIEEGMIMNINPNKVPRIIGKEGSMINMIKEATGCDITVGQNGIIWVRGNNIEDELFAKEVILYITHKSFIEGLTEQVKEYLNKHAKTKTKIKDIKPIEGGEEINDN